ncbi:hypothetical protein BH11ACT2_BH11ACT2_21660 [soil metagenome]
MHDLHPFRGRHIIAMAAVLALGTTVAISPAGLATAAGVNPKSKASVAAGYLSRYAPAIATPSGWTGSASTCSKGIESPLSKSATLSAVNYVRSLAGLRPAKLDSSLNSKALAAALVYRAQGDIAHNIPTNWPCYSADAAKAGTKSNIALGYSGAQTVTGYMDDAGAGNELAGHRRWILLQATTKIGTGSTDNTNALYVVGKWSTKKVKAPKWVPWPTAGYFPSQLEPDGRWSLGGDSVFDTNFSKAKVTVTSASGKKLRIKQYKPQTGVGVSSLVWEVAGIHAPSGTAAVRSYTVKVTGITKTGSKKKLSYTYTVKLFDPTVR